jgi:type I restriction enzyme, S subunit
MWKSYRIKDVIIENPKSIMKVRDSLTSGNYLFYTSGKKTTFSNEFLCKGKNIFIATGGKANFSYYDGKAAYSTDCYSITTKEFMDTKFLFYFFSLKTKEINISMFKGAALKHLQKNQFKNIIINIPPLAEQQRIVAKLDAAFAEIDVAIKTFENKKNQASKFFQRVLSNTIIKKSKNELSLTLKEIAKFLDYRGKTPPKKESGIKLLTAKNVRMGFIKQQPEEFVSEEGYKQHMTRGFPKVGDVVFTTEAPLGLTAQIEDDSFALGQRLITFQILNDVMKNTYLKFALMSETYQKKILEKGTGATVKGIKASILKQIKITFPVSLDEQEDRIALIEKVEKTCNELTVNYTKQISSYQSLKVVILSQELQSEAA